MDIHLDNLNDGEIIRLLEAHLADMYATSPPESVHALLLSALKHPTITFWCAKEQDEVLGCIALKALETGHGEIKSMRTAESARNKGVASALLAHLLKVAHSREYHQLSLETGSMDFFIPARRLYEKQGFSHCEPFGDYQKDPNSVFMTLKLE
jgi:putative acetyltransferase